MKILIFNQDWFAAELREFGHEVITCGSEPHLDHRIPFETNTLESVIASLNGFVPDAILWHDNSLPTFLIAGLEDTTIPLVLYSVDTFHHHRMHLLLAEIFDHVLVAQKDYVTLFDGCGTPVTWLPLWAPRLIEASDQKKWPVSFVGNLNAKLNPRRVAFFDELKHRIPIHITQGDYWEYFPFSEIVVNQTVKGDLNFRVFEAMMSGALLLTERTPNGLFDLFEEGKHLVTYSPDNVQEATEKVTHLLQQPQQMRAIAQAGRQEVISKHLPKHRAQTVNQILSTISKRKPALDRHFRIMINHVITSLLSMRNTGTHSIVSLTASLLAAQRGLEAGEALSDTQAGYLVRACYAYNDMTKSNLGSNIIAHFANTMPNQTIITLSAIRDLLNTGRRLEAEVIASQMSSSPADEVFKAAEQTVQAIFQAIN
ncbi:MAG: hypothetical protein RL518_1611 [Pseudomonadota bacterium]